MFGGGVGGKLHFIRFEFEKIIRNSSTFFLWFDSTQHSHLHTISFLLRWCRLESRKGRKTHNHKRIRTSKGERSSMISKFTDAYDNVLNTRSSPDEQGGISFDDSCYAFLHKFSLYFAPLHTHAVEKLCICAAREGESEKSKEKENAKKQWNENWWLEESSNESKE